MDRETLQQHIRTLAALPETEAPVVSCYLNLSGGLMESSEILDARLAVLRRVTPAATRGLLDEAIAQVDTFLRSEPLVGYGGVALFSRGGSEPFFLPLRFYVPVPTWIAADYLPSVYHLVALKDTYDRYIILLSTLEEARILEVSLGAVTKELWDEQPELRTRVGREWTKEHYQRRRREQTDRFIKEKVGILQKLMRAGGHTHLILAGDPRMVARVRRSLPKELAEKVVDTVLASGKDRTRDVVAATLSAFVDFEQQTSLATVEKLMDRVYRDGLAVVGLERTLDALRNSQVDQLVMSRSFPATPGWLHPPTQRIGLDRHELQEQSGAAGDEVREVDVKEEMVRLAELQGASVEFVDGSDSLAAAGEVGALLRYR